MRCECRDDSFDHAAHACPREATVRVTRRYEKYYGSVRRLALCPDCVYPSDYDRENLRQFPNLVSQEDPTL